jgi:hypothetical protein
VRVAFEEGHINYYAEKFGYLENDAGTLTIHPPFWISEDGMEAYYVGLPVFSGALKKVTADEIYDELYELGIKYGVITETIEEVIKTREKGENNTLTLLRIAVGDRPKKGEDAQIELFFEKDSQPGKILENGRMDYREIESIKTVKKNQLIAVKYPAMEGASGKNLKGEIIPAPPGDSKPFNAVNNIRVVQSKDKTLYYSTIEGRVVLVGDSGISVNQVFEVKGNVDFSTGNVEFNGDITIKGAVMPGFKVKAGGDITVNGIVNQGVELISDGNIRVKQGVLGRNNDTRLKAKGKIEAQFIQNAVIEADSDIIIKDYIMNSLIKAKGMVITPDKESSARGTGTIVGGEVIAMKGIIANSIGSEYAKMTKICVGIDYECDVKIRNFAKAIEYCNREILKLSKVLRLGFMDIKVFREKIAKLPQDKQRPFLEAFKKLGDVNKLKQEVLNKQKQMAKDTDELAQNAFIIVKKDLFPKVHIQIGETKLLNDKQQSGLKLKENSSHKKIDIFPLQAVSKEGGN